MDRIPLKIDFSERAPGKRRIKPVSRDKMQDIYKMLQEESDDNDSSCKEINSESSSEEASVRDAQADVTPAKQEISVPPEESRDFEPHCMICLGDTKTSTDEVVVCDGCGVCVHEECYGISENTEIMDNVSVESTLSTEPWFCNACLGSEPSPVCALCPNTGGAFKKTLCGRWVHLVCALVVPGVAFDDYESFDGISLLEMPYSSYGARKCCLCIDWRFSATGVTIQCESGLCRSYFHVSCALREGLLCNTYNETGNSGSSYFYAYCAQHSGPDLILARKRRWTTALMSTRSISPSKHNERVLAMMRDKYYQSRAKMVGCFESKGLVGVFARDLVTSKSGLGRLLRKAEMMKISTNINVQDFDISKLWFIPPGFNPEYIYYYMDRDKRIGEMMATLEGLKRDNRELRDRETQQIEAFEVLKVKMDNINNSRDRLQRLLEIISSLTKKDLVFPELANLSRPAGNIEICAICQSLEKQHLLAKCGVCRMSMHIDCLSPPLESVPKGGMRFAWRCYSCDVRPKEERSLRMRRSSVKPVETKPKRKYTKRKEKGTKRQKTVEPPRPKRKYTKRAKKEENRLVSLDKSCVECGREECNCRGYSGEDLAFRNVVTKSGRMTRQIWCNDNFWADSPVESHLCIAPCYYCRKDVTTDTAFVRCLSCPNVTHRACHSDYCWTCPDCV